MANETGSTRSTFVSLEAAMEYLPMPLENRPRVRDIAARLDYSHIWVPASRPYIAVADASGGPAVAYFNSGFVDLHRAEGGYDRELLPTNSVRGRGSARSGTDEPRICRTCFTQLPSSGVCDTC